MARRLMLTVDVEAQPTRAAVDPLDRLVWGRFPEGELGLAQMMEVAEKHGARMTMFLDYAEENLYGDAFLDVGREIRRRGHDLQLHLHQNFLPDDFYRERKIARVHDFNLTDERAGRAFAEYLCDAQERAGGEAPVAFRGGGYRFSGPMLAELHARGVRLDSSYNPSRITQPLTFGPKKQFTWDFGGYEIPISIVDKFRGLPRLLDYNWGASVFLDCSIEECVSRHVDFLDQFHARHDEDAVAVLVFHSWSLMRMNEEGHYATPVAEGVERLDAILAALAPTTEIVDAPTVLGLLEEGQIGLEMEDVVFRYDPPKAEEPSTPLRKRVAGFLRESRDRLSRRRDNGRADWDSRRCPICGTPRSKFQDADTAGRRCTCGSLERQRVFAALYRAHGFDLSGKRVFAISPSVVERRLFDDYGVGEVIHVDIQPEANPDVVADVCEMPQVPDESYDVVFASYILTCVHDVDGALSEFARVLRPGGKLYCSDPVAPGQRTEEFTDLEKITAWYGKEAYEKYRVGSFRRLGELDVRDIIGRCFDVEAYSAEDPATDTTVVWHVGVKQS